MRWKQKLEIPQSHDIKKQLTTILSAFLQAFRGLRPDLCQSHTFEAQSADYSIIREFEELSTPVSLLTFPYFQYGNTEDFDSEEKSSEEILFRSS